MGGFFVAVNEKKQQEILDSINKQINEKGYPPTVREICAAVGLKSPSTVHGYLQRLEKKGLLEKIPSKTRAIRVAVDTKRDKVKTIDKYIEVPVLGKISAGLPILAEENIIRTFPLPMDFAQNEDIFMLQVRGESMINKGILDGDFVVVRKQESVPNGTVAVALVGDEATVKTFYKEKGYYRLQPENDYMEPIICKEVQILGKVIGVLRIMK
ncbi:MAG: transcriptional repressor LexA [Clostridiaceae bacterium]|nr:transcriptional repressor LexA [Clostridiaceae bacterium]